jgi:hypothetical protein
LKSELNSGDVPRVAKAHGSSEFNIDQARLLIETIDYLTKQILKKPNGIDLWIQLADTLADSDRLNNLIHICVEKIIQQCPLKEYFKVLISSSQTMLVRTILIGVIGQEFGLTYPKKMKGWYED